MKEIDPASVCEIVVAEVGSLLCAFVTKLGDQHSEVGATAPILSVPVTLMGSQDVQDAYRELASLLGQHIAQDYMRMRAEH